jgi:hypothetical protein
MIEHFSVAADLGVDMEEIRIGFLNPQHLTMLHMRAWQQYVCVEVTQEICYL